MLQTVGRWKSKVVDDIVRLVHGNVNVSKNRKFRINEHHEWGVLKGGDGLMIFCWIEHRMRYR